MALTLTEISLIYKGIIKPELTSLRELVEIASIRHYNWFEANKKETDEGSLARSYSDKMTDITKQMTLRNENLAKIITLNLIVAAGNIANYSDMENYNTSQWEGFVENNIVTALEASSFITTAEKTAYNGL